MDYESFQEKYPLHSLYTNNYIQCNQSQKHFDTSHHCIYLLCIATAVNTQLRFVRSLPSTKLVQLPTLGNLFQLLPSDLLSDKRKFFLIN